jgi:hypothetical protein
MTTSQPTTREIVGESDYQLLVRAAKAVNGGAWHPLTHENKWNPLTNNDDAFRLAVKLKLGVFVCEGVVVAEGSMDTKDACEPLGKDSEAATRRAIVRAAAEYEFKENTDETAEKDTASHPDLADKQQALREALLHLDDIESVMGGRNGSSIRLRTLVVGLSS